MNVEFENGLLRIEHTRNPYGLRFEGAVDSSNITVFGEALRRLARGPHPELHADLSGVEFIDVAGMRALVCAARRLDAGRVLVVDPVPRHVVHLLRMVGWDAAPGLRLNGRSR